MKKIKLYGVGNDGEFNYYIFDKTKKIHKILDEIFRKSLGIEWPLIKERYGNNDKLIIDKINIEKYNDSHEKIGRLSNKRKNPDNRVDIFYGDKKIFVVIHCSQKERKKLNNELKKIVIISKK